MAQIRAAAFEDRCVSVSLPHGKGARSSNVETAEIDGAARQNPSAFPAAQPSSLATYSLASRAVPGLVKERIEPCHRINVVESGRTAGEGGMLRETCRLLVVSADRLRARGCRHGTRSQD